MLACSSAKRHDSAKEAKLLLLYPGGGGTTTVMDAVLLAPLVSPQMLIGNDTHRDIEAGFSFEETRVNATVVVAPGGMTSPAIDVKVKVPEPDPVAD